MIRTKKHKINEMKKTKAKYEDSIKIIEKYRNKKDIITDYKPLLLYISKKKVFYENYYYILINTIELFKMN